MISHKHKTIFVHIPKTGGQSVESVFIEDEGLTWDTRAPLLLRRNDDRTLGPQRLAHLYASEYVGLGHIDQASFEAYTRFAVVRHPYDRAISEYRMQMHLLRRPWYKRLRRLPTFEEVFDLRGADPMADRTRHAAPQSRYIFDPSGAQLVPHVLRFERLGEDMPGFLRGIFNKDIVLPHRNRAKTTVGPARVDLTAGQKRLLQGLYAEDFERFGYQP